MAAKMVDELEIAYMSFSYAVIMVLGTNKKNRREILGLGNGWWSGTTEEPIMAF